MTDAGGQIVKAKLEALACKELVAKNVNASSLQSIYTYLINTKSLVEFIYNLNQIKDPVKRRNCFAVLFGKIVDSPAAVLWFEEMLTYCLAEDKLYPCLGTECSELAIQWELMQFFLLSRISHQIVLLSTSKKNEGE